MIRSNISIILKSFRKRKINLTILILQTIVLGLMIGMLTNVVGSLKSYNDEISIITTDIYKVKSFPNIDSKEIEEMFSEKDIQFEEVEKVYFTNKNNEKGHSENVFMRTKHNTNELDLIVDGEFPSSNNQVALGVGYATVNNIEIGSQIVFDDESFEVVGLYQNPEEYQLFDISKSSNISLNDNVPVIVTQEAINSLDYETSIEYYSKLSNEDVKELINDSKVLSIDAVDTSIIDTLADTNQQLLIISSIMILFTIMIALFLQVRSIIIDNKPSIGVLISMGLKPSDISLSYSIFGLITFILTLVGALIGNNLGSYYFEMITSTYNMTINSTLSDNTVFFALISLLISLTITIIVVFYVRKIVKQTPLSMIRGSVKSKKYKGHSQRKTWIPFKLRIQLTNISSNKIMSLLFIFSTVVSMFLFQFSVSLTTSTKPLIDDYDNLLKYEVKSYLDTNVYDEKDEKYLFYETSGKLISNQTTEKEIMATNPVLAIDDNNDSIDFIKDEIKHLGENEVIIPVRFAQEYEINMGDILMFVIDTQEIDLKVIGINSVYLDNDMYISSETIDQLHEEINLPKDRNGIFKSDDDATLSVNKAELLKAGASLTDSIKSITIFLQVFSIFIFLLTMIMFSELLIEKHRKEITLLVAEGYSYLQSIKVFTSYFNLLIVISGIIVSVISPFLLAQMSKELSKTVGFNLYFNANIRLVFSTTIVGIIIFNIYLFLNYLKNKNMNLEKILKAEE